MKRVTELGNRVWTVFKSPAVILSFLLAVITASVFLRACQGGFLLYDDKNFILLNPHLRGGMTLKGLEWALRAGLFSGTEGYLDYWQPVTVISRLLDMQFYGLNPAGHHLTNLLLHVFNVLLLFLILRKTTGAVYRSALAAAFFGLHPIQTEAVAWITARKDVLSMFFGLLMVWAYAGYAGKPGWKRGAAVFILFALALMSKPVFVTLPFVLLLLDYWPLSRTRGGGGVKWWRIWARLIAEKIPLFVLSFLAVLVVLRGRPEIMTEAPLSSKLSNAVIFYIVNLGKWIIPRDFSVRYAYPGLFSGIPPYPLWQVAAAAATMVIISLIAAKSARGRAFVIVGWLWYLGALLPTVGVMMHDRHMYLPSIGLAILAAWGIPALGERLHVKKKLVAAGLVFVLLIGAVLAFIRTGYWGNEEMLYRRSIAVEEKEPQLKYFLCNLLFSQSRYSEALPYCEAAVRNSPNVPLFQNLLGYVLLGLDRLDEAESHFREAVRLFPQTFSYRLDLDNLLRTEGRFKEADQSLAEAREGMLPVLLETLRRDPGQFKTAYDLGVLLARTGSGEEALPYFEQALRINPLMPEVSNDYGETLEALGRYDAALALYEKTTQTNPNFENGYLRAGDLLSRRGAYEEAAVRYERALRINPNNPRTAKSLARIENYRKVIRYYREALRSNPGDAKAHYNLGYSLAVLGAYDEAAGHYRNAVNLDPNYLQAYFNLGNCYAKLGKFEEAAAAYQKALALDPAGETIHYNMGLVLEKLGKTDEAGRHYAEALKIKPGYEDARKKLGGLDKRVRAPV